MAKVSAPILSGRARGQIGKTQVYGSWRGVQYARSYVSPRNPQTTAQTNRRNVFSAISDLWKRLGSIARAPWDASVVGRPLTNRNRIISVNLKAMQGEADRAEYVGSPGAAGGVAPTALSAEGGAASGEIDVTVTSPAAPTDWELTAVDVFAMQDGDPKEFVPAPIIEAEDLDPIEDGDTEITLTGLEPDTLHVVTAWLRWSKPDGTEAFGASLTTTATTTA